MNHTDYRLRVTRPHESPSTVQACQEILRSRDRLKTIYEGATIPMTQDAAGIWQPESSVWVPGPLVWFWCYTKTYDEQWLENGLEPYRPMARLPYFPWLFNRFLTEPRMFTPKTREMRLSWAVMSFAVWLCQFFEKTRVTIQSQKEDKVTQLIKGKKTPGYARTLLEQQPAWLRNRREFQLADRIEEFPGNELEWRNGSVLQGIPHGPDQIRSFHPYLYIADEAAHIDDFGASYEAANFVCPRIIAVSSAAPGYFGDVCQSSAPKLS
jgi:hypothetical protein